MADYERGVLDGFEVAVRLHGRAFEECRNLNDVRRALGQYQREAHAVVDAIVAARLGAVAAYFGFPPGWVREAARAAAGALELAEAEGQDADALEVELRALVKA